MGIFEGISPEVQHQTKYDVCVEIVYCLILFQCYYVVKYLYNNYIIYLSIWSHHTIRSYGP